MDASFRRYNLLIFTSRNDTRSSLWRSIIYLCKQMWKIIIVKPYHIFLDQKGLAQSEKVYQRRHLQNITLPSLQISHVLHSSMNCYPGLFEEWERGILKNHGFQEIAWKFCCLKKIIERRYTDRHILKVQVLESGLLKHQGQETPGIFFFSIYYHHVMIKVN